MAGSRNLPANGTVHNVDLAVGGADRVNKGSQHLCDPGAAQPEMAREVGSVLDGHAIDQGGPRPPTGATRFGARSTTGTR